MKRAICSFIFLYTFELFAQTSTVVQVVDEKSKTPLGSVGVIINQRDTVAFTNSRGFFQIEVEENSSLTLFKQEYFDLQLEIQPESKSFKIGMKKNLLDTAEYFLGNQALKQHLLRNMRFPMSARKKKISGRVYTAFKIDESGNIKGLTFLNSLGGGLEEQIKTILEDLPYKFIPGREDVEFVVAFTFKYRNQLRESWPAELKFLQGRVSLGEIIISVER